MPVQRENLALATIIAILSIVGTCFAISNNFVSRSEFTLFGTERATRLDAFDKRFDRIEAKADKIDSKLDRLLEANHIRYQEEK